MKLLILPVSGGGYVNQLSVIKELCMVEYKPDLTLASSGGNVCAYIASAADWNSHSINRIAQDMSKSMFSRPWSNVAVISYIIAFFQGNAFDEGKGVKEFFFNRFNKETISKYEIWTGTYNKDLQIGTNFCNRRIEDSILKGSLQKIENFISQNCKWIFMDNNIDMIIDASVSSAAIPAIIPPRKIGEENYVDGGVFGASPLLSMGENIINHIRDSKDYLHLIYLNPLNFKKPQFFEGNNIMSNWRQTFSNIVNAQTLIDCQIAYQMLLILNGSMIKMEFPNTVENLKELEKIKKSHYLLEIYPETPQIVDLVNFSGNQVEEMLRFGEGKNLCSLWGKREDLILCNFKNL